MAKDLKREATERRGYWSEQISKAGKLYSDFQTAGDRVIDRYRTEKGNVQQNRSQDRFNILYSSTETMRPSLYAQTPKIEAKLRHKDRTNPVARDAVQLLEVSVQYGMEEIDFDEVMENCVEDYVLPGMGQAWVRYVPSFKEQTDGYGQPVLDEKNKPVEVLDFEDLGLDYVHWKDFLMGPARVWKEVPWVAKRVYMDKKKAAARFGPEKASALSYTQNNADKSREEQLDGKQAIIWEIWNKDKREVVWFCDSYADDVLDRQDDPLRLKNFFPCPRPMRAVSNTRTMIPRPFYAQYQSQAEELDKITNRIRILSDALQVRGVYDGSQEELQNLLSAGGGNKMVKVENWQSFVQQGGIKGSVDWVPISEIAQVLMELLKARDVCKAEIYEITGFSDIVRGQSKASETLGAQQIKQDWASARLRKMQKEVQRFARDLVRLMAEIISEQFQVESLALYAGFDITGNPEQDVQLKQRFEQAIKLLKSEKDRCALIGIETDSTIMPDEANERKDRMEFLGQIGAFLQQAGPMALQYPDMRGLLGAIMMFTVRTFRASRSIEQEFEAFQEKLANQPAVDPNKKEGDDGAAKAQAAMQLEQMKQQGEQQKMQAEGAARKYEIDTQAALDREAEANRHEEKVTELQIKQQELQIAQSELDLKTAELEIKQQELELKRDEQQHDAALDAENLRLQEEQQEHEQGQDIEAGDREDEALAIEADAPDEDEA